MIVPLRRWHRTRPAPEAAPDNSAERKALRQALARLSERERVVLALWYCRPKKTLDQIGETLGGITRERVRQIKDKAVMKLRPDIEFVRRLES